MARLVSQYQTFALLYLTVSAEITRKTLEDALASLFYAILRYQMVIVRHASSWKLRVKPAFGDKAASAPQQAIDEVKRCEEQLATVQKSADCEINDIYFQKIFELIREKDRANNNELDARIAELHNTLVRCEEM